MRGNTVTMTLAKEDIARAGELFQYDYGQRLILDGVELPTAYEVHFSNKERGESKTSIGDSTGVDIPDEYLQTGENIHVWLYLHDGEDDGETEYHGIISVHKRAKPKNAEPTPVQQDVITQTIAALDDAVEEAEGIAAAIPETIDQALQEAKDSGEFDGYSPIAYVTKEGRIATITITDKDGTTTATVSDATADNVIDDTAGAGVRDKTWSADKIATVISDINSFDIEIVHELPTENIKLHTIYFVEISGETGDFYDEYMYVEDHWEQIGTTEVDLNNKADKSDTILLTTLSRGRKEGTVVGANSFAFGLEVTASGSNTHVEGYRSTASGSGAHAEGGNTTASAQYSHSEGESTTASGIRSHAEGYSTTASGSASHGEGYSSAAHGRADHAEGYSTIANSTSSGGTNASGAHAEGYYTTASNTGAHAEGGNTGASGIYSHAEGYSTQATAYASHAEGESTVASGQDAHAEGSTTKASAPRTHAEGYNTQATSTCAHAEGAGSIASGQVSHAEGFNTQAKGYASHAEGQACIAGGVGSHAEGAQTETTVNNAHAEGRGTIASGTDSHVAGTYNIEDVWPEFVPNTHYYVGDKVEHIGNGYICKIENTDSTFVYSHWENQGQKRSYSEIIGNGEDKNNRSNAYALDWDGNGHFAGDVYVNCNNDSTGGNKVAAIDDTAGAGAIDKAWSANKLVTEFGNKLNAPSLGEKRNVLTLDNNRRPAWAENINVYEVTIPVEANSTSLPKYNIFNIRNDNITTKSRVIGWESTTAKYYTYLNYTLESAYTSMPGVVSGDLEILPGAPAGTIKLYIADVA